MKSPTLSTATPTLKVFDPRGRTVRTLHYNRSRLDAPAQRLISHVSYCDASRVTCWRDPRRFDAWTADPGAAANLTQTACLSGQVLRRESSDNGERIALFDVQGRLAWSRDGRGTVQQVDYDLLGRPLSRRTQPGDGAASFVSARYVYGDADPATPQPERHNLRGVCVHQYDQAGQLSTASVGLSGAVLRSSQTFLRNAEGPVDWGTAPSPDSARLEAVSYGTLTQVDALGAPLVQTDAGGHQQHWAYDVSGQLLGRQLQLAGQEQAQILFDQVAYNAAGQVLHERTAAACTTTYAYQAQTRRLQGMRVVREHDQALLQSLAYRYDPVGNLVESDDASVATDHFRNQATNAVRTFGYDALSQLISATGREQAGAGPQDQRLPALLTPIPGDSGHCVNYTRRYSYDDSGNLTSLVHVGASTYTQAMLIDPLSNRSVRQPQGAAQVGVSRWFDANGNLQSLQTQPDTQQSLLWNADDGLQAVVLLDRQGDLQRSDRELYQYREGVRVRKQTRRLVNAATGLWSVEEVRYLPGLEWRTSFQESQGASGMLQSAARESLQTLVCQAGRSGVRVLHWLLGKPAGLANDGLRLSLDDLVGSSRLELDGLGQTLSREEYYPFGGTAVWAARSQLEASYKTVRYSGKERDATGLYCYGYRYYAPWLCRWISADPAGEVDGLNLYRMVRNNPMTLLDPDGLTPVDLLDWLDLASTERPARLESAIYANQPEVREKYQAFSANTQAILKETEDSEKVLKAQKTPAQRIKRSQTMTYTNAKLKNFAAHAGVLNGATQAYQDGFVNFPGTVAGKGIFAGIQSIDPGRSSRLGAYHPDTLLTAKGWRPRIDMGYYRVTDEDAFVGAIRQQYSAGGTELHPVVESRIRQHVARNAHVLPKEAGVAGLHAEVQALNHALSQPRAQGAGTSATLNSLFIYTQRLVGKQTGDDFPACHNCAGIISGLENVMTGKVSGNVRQTRRHSI